MRPIRSICAIVILASSSSSLAQWGMGPRGSGMARHAVWGQNCLAQIDLSAQQVDSILAIFKDFDPTREREAVELRGLLLQLRNLSIAKADSGKISEAEAKIANIKAAQIKTFHNQWVRIDAVLTAKQRIACTAEYENRMGMDFWLGGMMGMGNGW
jgi:Spy/CpxP family protein refolding chaperone